MVLSFACPAARYSAKGARGRPRMAMTGRRGRSRSGCMLSAQIPPKGVGQNSADLPRLGEPAHRPEVDRAKGRGYPQVWSVDGFLDA